MHNVGSIFRTADAAGVEKIYLCGITPAPTDRFGRPVSKITKVSLDAEKWVTWEKVGQTTMIIDKLKRDGFKIYAIEQSKKSVPYYKLKVKSEKLKVALILGSEMKGLSQSILKRADKILEIPMRGAMVRQAHHPRNIKRGKESLNVAVAFGIVVFNLSH
jgi:tRNA G18 (ribose-2'-O)-methylase SpoU